MYFTYPSFIINFIKKHFGGVDNDNKDNLKIPPTDISNVPMNLEQLIIIYDDEKKADLVNEIKRRKEYIMEKKRTETSGDVVSDTLDIIKETFDNLRIYLRFGILL